jgi:hypothetical protein
VRRCILRKALSIALADPARVNSRLFPLRVQPNSKLQVKGKRTVQRSPKVEDGCSVRQLLGPASFDCSIPETFCPPPANRGFLDLPHLANEMDACFGTLQLRKGCVDDLGMKLGFRRATHFVNISYRFNFLDWSITLVEFGLRLIRTPARGEEKRSECSVGLTLSSPG